MALSDKEKLDMWSRCPWKLGDTVNGNEDRPVVILDIVEWHSFSTWTMKVYDVATEEQMEVVLDKFSNQVLDENFVEV